MRRLVISRHTLEVICPGLFHINADSTNTAQTLTIDITLCGDYAGLASLLEETCGPLIGTNTWCVPLHSRSSGV